MNEVKGSLTNLTASSRAISIETTTTNVESQSSSLSMNVKYINNLQSNDEQTKTLNQQKEVNILLGQCTGEKIENSTIDYGVYKRRTIQDYFQDIRCFTFFICLLVMLINALTVGYKNSVVTTIEKRFEFSSGVSGILSGFLEIGSLITTLLVSYFCSRSHIPKAIAISSILCAIGSLLYALPHVISDSYTVNNKVMNQTTEDLICKIPLEVENQIEFSALMQKSPISFLEEKLKLDPACLLKVSNWQIFAILIIASILIGSSSAPLYTLGTTYIDNHVTKDNSSIYLGFMYSMLAFGPVVGYLAGAGLLQIYVDGFHYSADKMDVKPGDSNWVGAWYSGFVIFAILIIIVSVPIFFFPKVIKKNRKEVEIENDKLQVNEKVIDENTYGDLKSFPKATWNLLKNRVFMNVTMAYCFEINIIAGFMLFLPKYIEHQFDVDSSMSNIYTGGVALPGAIFGIVLGGYLVKRLRMVPVMASKMAIGCNIICIFGIFLLAFLGCQNIKMAGTTTTYDSNELFTDTVQLSSSCNQNCQCSSTVIKPICGINGLTYFSPCHAGCKEYKSVELDGTKETTYMSCSCISNDLQNKTLFRDSLPVVNAHPGTCSSNCKTLAPFLLVLFIITLLTAINQMPMLMVTLRSVNEIEKPFALGLQLVILRLLAYIPSPLVFGHSIDWSCLVWHKDECDKIGSCLFYDREKFRNVYGLITAIYKIFALFLFILLFFSTKKFERESSSVKNSNLSQDEKMNLKSNETD